MSDNKIKYKCGGLSLSAAAAALAFAAVGGLLVKEVCPFDGMGAAAAITAMLLYNAAMWSCAAVFSVLWIIASMMFYSVGIPDEEGKPFPIKLPCDLVTMLVGVSVVELVICIAVFFMAYMLSGFIGFWKIFVIMLAPLLIGISSGIFAVKVNIESEVFYSF